MRKINIYPIKSLMSYGDLVSKDSLKLLTNLRTILGNDYNFSYIDSFDQVKKNDFILILVQSGGSEGIFKEKIFHNFEGPYYLLTYGSSNSLAASLEILSFIKQQNRKGEVLHGDDNYIAERIKTLASKTNISKPARLGVFGKPSDWLISSEVNYQKCHDILNIDLIDVSQEEVLAEISSVDLKSLSPENYDYNSGEIKKALQIYEGLKKIVNKYNLDGFTIRCFDIIKIVKSSACLGLGIFNKDNITASCEGDIPAMLTAYLIFKKLHTHTFQANPQWINPVTNEIEFAHCTLPLDMSDDITYDTHFESGIGVGIHGEMKKGDVTIVKINSGLNEFYCEEGTLIANDYRRDRCRTQIKIKMDSPVTYFLTSSLGNHHQIIYGHHQKELKEYFELLGLRQVK